MGLIGAPTVGITHGTDRNPTKEIARGPIALSASMLRGLFLRVAANGPHDAAVWKSFLLAISFVGISLAVPRVSWKSILLGVSFWGI